MDLVRIAGLKRYKDKNGNTYFMGHINPISVVMVMPNTFKKDDKEPDYFLYVKQNERSEKRENELEQDGLLF